MSRNATGTVECVVLSDGTRAFHLRFRAGGERRRVLLHEREGCDCGCGGGWSERGARHELGNVIARVRAGVWQPATRPVRPSEMPIPEPDRAPTFHEYASAWLQAKVSGVLGDKPIDANTQSDYRWRLSRHLLPFFAKYRLGEIDRDLCLAFKGHKLQEAAEIRAAVAAGADLRDRRGRRVQPLRAQAAAQLPGDGRAGGAARRGWRARLDAGGRRRDPGGNAHA
jgi:hypothetical protein